MSARGPRWAARRYSCHRGSSRPAPWPAPPRRRRRLPRRRPWPPPAHRRWPWIRRASHTRKDRSAPRAPRHTRRDDARSPPPVYSARPWAGRPTRRPPNGRRAQPSVATRVTRMETDHHRRTHRLELDDQSLREWDAIVLDSAPEGIVLDRSAFYPGGGGQPPDHGVLLWQGVQTRIEG